MVNMNKCRLLICLGLSLIMGAFAVTAADAGLFGLFKSKKKAPPVTRTSMIVFPFDQTGSGRTPQAFGQEVASYLRSMMAENDGYIVILYREQLPPIRRASEDTTLKTQDLAPPFSEDKSKALKLARVLAADLYVVGAIEDYQFDPTKKAAQMTLSAELYNAETGRLVGQYLVTGSADESSNAAYEEEYRAVAAGKAVEALKERIMPDKASEQPAAEAASRPPANDGSQPAPEEANAAEEAAPPAPTK